MSTEIQFEVSFKVAESDLGHVMASLYKSAQVFDLAMSPIEKSKRVASSAPTVEEPVHAKPAQSATPAATRRQSAKEARQITREARRTTRQPKGRRLGDAIVAALRKGPMRTTDLRKVVESNGYVVNGLFSCLHRLVENKSVSKMQPGLYALPPADETSGEHANA